MPPEQPLSGGQGEELSRSDVRLVAQAFRADWPIAPATRKRLLTRMARLCLRKGDARIQIAAFKAVVAAQRNMLLQQRLDLAHEVLDLKTKGDGRFNLTEAVAEAEQLALEFQPAERPEPNPPNG